MFHKGLLKVYLVTDHMALKGRDFYQAIEQALQGGVTLVQLREKEISSREYYEKAVKIKNLTDQYSITLIINDRVDIALAVGAAGVHVGQKDLPVSKVREIVGSQMIVGATAKTVSLAVQAEKEGADYIGSGAIFQTSTKQDAAALSMKELKEITTSIHIPVVAIGGINIGNMEQLKGTGVAGIAVSSGILGEMEPAKAAEKMKKAQF